MFNFIKQVKQNYLKLPQIKVISVMFRLTRTHSQTIIFLQFYVKILQKSR